MRVCSVALAAMLCCAPAMAQIASPGLVREAALRHGVPGHLAQAIIRVESGFRCRARNGHALGIGQVLPRTARSVGVTGNLLECRTGLEAAMRYLRAAIARGGPGCAGLSLYNLGIYARPRCTAYGRRVLALAAREARS